MGRKGGRQTCTYVLRRFPDLLVSTSGRHTKPGVLPRCLSTNRRREEGQTSPCRHLGAPSTSHEEPPPEPYNSPWWSGCVLQQLLNWDGGQWVPLGTGPQKVSALGSSGKGPQELLTPHFAGPSPALPTCRSQQRASSRTSLVGMRY